MEKYYADIGETVVAVFIIGCWLGAPLILWGIISVLAAAIRLGADLVGV